MNDITVRFPRGVKTNSFRGIFAAVLSVTAVLSAVVTADAKTVCYFSGKNTYIQATKYPLADSVSLSAWVRVSPNITTVKPALGNTIGAGIVGQGYWGGTTGLGFFANTGVATADTSDDGIAWQVRDGGNIATAEYIDATLFSSDEWHHYLLVRDKDAGKARFYVDGELVHEANFSSSYSIYPRHNFAIGKNMAGAGGCFCGYVAEVALWNVALGADDAAVLPIFGPENISTAPYAYFPLDEGSGNSVSEKIEDQSFTATGTLQWVDDASFTGGDPSSKLTVSSSLSSVGEPSPSLGVTTGLSAGAILSVSCGTTPWTNADGSIQYVCTGWKLYDKDNTVVSNGNETSFTYTHPTPAAYRKLEWQWEPTHVRGTIAAGEGGSVNPSGTAWYSLGESVTVTATPDEGGHFICWGGTLPDGIDATSAEVTFTTTAPFAMAAIFQSEFYVSTMGSDNNSGSESSPFATISNAIEKADKAFAVGGVDSVTIHVADGTYAENSLAVTNAITIVGNPSDRTAVKIGGDSTSRVFSLTGTGAMLSCVTVQGGSTYKAVDGGCVYMTGDCIITNCVVTGAKANSRSGNNLYMSDGLVVDSELSAASTQGIAYGLNLYISGGRAMRCVLKDAGGSTGNSFGVYLAGGILESSLVTGSKTQRGAVVMSGASARMVNCSIIQNTYCNRDYQDCLGVRVDNENALVANCVIYDNGGTRGKEWAGKNAACFKNCAFSAEALYNGTTSSVTNLTDADFKDYSNADWRPARGSLLTDAGCDASSFSPAPTSSLDLAGSARFTGNALDIGCYEVDQVSPDFLASSWGPVNDSEIVFTPLYGASGDVLVRWDFDDGGEVVQCAGTETVTHSFSQSKIHHVSLSVSTDNGATWSDPLVKDMVSAPAHIYVDASSTNPVFPYATPETAAATLADALCILTNTTSCGGTDVDGVTIHVAAGTYPENGLVRLDSAVTILGDADDRTAVKIGGNSSSRVFLLTGVGATLSGLTVQGGTSAKNVNGGCVYMSGDCVITNCVVTGAKATDYFGNNLYMSAGLVVDSELSAATTAQRTYGLNLYICGGRAMRCTIKDGIGTTGASYAVYLDGGILESSLVTGSKTRYGAVFVDAKVSAPLIVNCSIIQNTYIHASYQNCLGIIVYNDSARIVNTVIFDNGKTPDKEWGNRRASCFINCAFSEEAAYSGTASTVTNLTDADFKDYANGDFHPAKDGVLINAGTKWADYTTYGAASTTDLAGEPRLSGRFLDIGCYEVPSGAGFTLIVR